VGLRAFSAFGQDDVEEVIVAEGLIGKSMIHSAEDFGFTIDLNEAVNFFAASHICVGGYNIWYNGPVFGHWFFSD
jgi:hypothetical protein